MNDDGSTPLIPPIEALLRTVDSMAGTDLYLLVGRPPMVSLHGRLESIGETTLTPAHLEKFATQLMSDEERRRFEDEPEYNTALSVDSGRFRLNVYRQRGTLGMVARRLTTELPTLEGLGLPDVLGGLCLEKRGLVLVTGATGSGKSTTLAAMVNQRNLTSASHIITVEDPVEFIHPHKKGIVSQREVGTDTESFASALKQALRQAPEAILIGEIRDREVAAQALQFSDTGHLVMSTLHSTNATQTLERLVHLFPHDMRDQIMLMLALNLKGIVSQRLVKTVDGGRAAALEILLPSSRIRELIRTGQVEEIGESIAASRDEGMQTFDQALLDLYFDERISQEEALSHADAPNDLALRIKVRQPDADGTAGIEIGGDQRPQQVTRKTLRTAAHFSD